MPDTAPLDLDTELSALEAMTPKELRVRYREVWGDETRTGNKRFLIKRIAWKLQANAEGDLPQRVRDKALALARDSDLRTTAPRNLPPRQYHATPGKTVERGLHTAHANPLTPGRQLTREYKGQTVVVTVLADGFAYAGQRYASLSAAAKAITGSHVSGHAFFKLTPGTSPRKDAK
jgi:hypothetical protein